MRVKSFLLVGHFKEPFSHTLKTDSLSFLKSQLVMLRGNIFVSFWRCACKRKLQGCWINQIIGYLPNGADCPQGFSIHLEKIKTKNTLKNFVLSSNWSLVATPREFLRWENLELNISFSLSHQYLRNSHCMWPACIFPGKNYQAHSLYFTRN